jgi:hypothetical protein
LTRRLDAVPAENPHLARKRQVVEVLVDGDLPRCPDLAVSLTCAMQAKLMALHDKVKVFPIPGPVFRAAA